MLLLRDQALYGAYTYQEDSSQTDMLSAWVRVSLQTPHHKLPQLAHCFSDRRLILGEGNELTAGSKMQGVDMTLQRCRSRKQQAPHRALDAGEDHGQQLFSCWQPAAA
jgi:hypothetical protein